MPDRPAARARDGLTAVVATFGGAWIALHHPLWPGAALAGFGFWIALAAWRPWLWLAVLPAAVPVLSFAPWTGWLMVDEFDLGALGAIAVGFGRRALADPAASLYESQPPGRFEPAGVGAVLLGGLLGALGALGMVRGYLDAQPSAAGWFQGYTDPFNSWRVCKSLLYALLLWPLVRQEIRRATEPAVRALSAGMLTGLAIVSMAVMWERYAYPGLLNFSARYRTVGLFWEMHVGGAAIDAYLALATPFVAWALWKERSPLRWGLAALLGLLVAYACLTTFSRGVYLAVAGPLLLLGAWLSGQRFGFDPRRWLPRLLVATLLGTLLAVGLALAYGAWHAAGVGVAAALELALLGLLRRRLGPAARHWRPVAAMALALALAIEAVVVLGAGSFMLKRVSASERDFGSRVAHWQRGVGLLAGPADWLFGIGLGRLPAHYAAIGRNTEFSGAVEWLAGGAGGGLVQLSGPATLPSLGGLYALTQRVPLQPVAAYRVGLEVRAERLTEVEISVCEMHLLYERQCQAAWLRVQPGPNWQRGELHLAGPLLDAGSAYAPRRAVLALTVVRAGTRVELRSLSLRGSDGPELLRNGHFAQGLAQWFPAAKDYFLPWHIDNLYLEALIERGASGTLALAALIGWALWAPLSGASVARTGSQAIAPFVAAALVGVLIVGLVSSVLDVPRVAFLFLLLAMFSIELARSRNPSAGKSP